MRISLIAITLLIGACGKAPVDGSKSGPSGESTVIAPRVTDQPQVDEVTVRKQKRLAELTVELMDLEERAERDPAARDDPEFKRRGLSVANEGKRLILQLSGNDPSREDAVVEEAIKLHAPERYEALMATKEKRTITFALAKLEGIRMSLEQYKAEYGNYPTEEEGLRRLTAEIPGRPTPFVGGGEEGLKDPWGSPMVYELLPSGASYILRSLGPDRTPGSRDDIEIK